MSGKSIRELKSFIRICGYAVLFLYFFSGYVLTSYRIEGNSMNPLLHHGERVLSNRLTYKMAPIRRGDVVVFNCPSEPYKYYIKRIIGMPGETIEIRDGIIYADRRPISSAFIPEEFQTHEDLDPVRVPLGHYFVAGDHRNTSLDSRSWATKDGFWPYVPERYIQGKITFRLWPVSRFGALEELDSDAMLADNSRQSD